MSTTQIPSRAEYEANEMRLAAKALREVETAPLIDRQEARKEWAEALLDPELIGERVSWLINGSYGHGQCQMAKNACEGRGNKVATLGQMIAAFEWRCPADFARQAWSKLTQAQKTMVNLAIAREIETAEFPI